VFPIEAPPLRERHEDIPMLCWTFVKEFGNSMGKLIDEIADESMTVLREYHWPGNVRELRNVIERAMILSHGPTLHIKLSHTPPRPGTVTLTASHSTKPSGPSFCRWGAVQLAYPRFQRRCRTSRH
jgi:formate hydrogenlyase transcriptional activator